MGPPNPRDSWEALLANRETQLRVHGVAYFWIVPNQYGLPVEVWGIPVEWVTPRTDDGGRVVYYEIQGSQWAGGMMRLAVEEVAVFGGVKPGEEVKKINKPVNFREWL